MELQPLAALVSRQAADLEVYAGFLYSALGELPPEYLQVERASSVFGRLRGKQGDIVAVTVRLGENQYALRRVAVGSTSQPTIAHVVGGIVLSTKAVGLAEWSAQLAHGLQEFAESNADAAAALQRLTSFIV